MIATNRNATTPCVNCPAICTAPPWRQLLHPRRFLYPKPEAEEGVTRWVGSLQR